VTWDQKVFWGLSLLALVAAPVTSFYFSKKRTTTQFSLQIINHILLILLMILFVLHIGIYAGQGWLADALRQAERVLFPVYLWALLTHILCNIKFYKKSTL
jgi:phosphoglycerol transferase MdoB-like AlkP superfamily enzyme